MKEGGHTLCNLARTYERTTYLARSISVCTRTRRKCSSSDVAGSARSRDSIFPCSVSHASLLQEDKSDRAMWTPIAPLALGARQTHLLLHLVQHAVDELALPLQHGGDAALLDPSALEKAQVVLGLGLGELLLGEHCERQRVSLGEGDARADAWGRRRES